MSIPRKRIEELHPWFFSESGIKRIARNKHIQASANRDQQQQSTATQEPQRRNLKNAQSYLACVLLAKNGRFDNHDRELLYVTHALSRKWPDCAVLAIVLGDSEQNLGEWGADLVIHHPQFDLLCSYQPEAMTRCVQGIITDYQPKHIVLADNDWGGGDLLRRLAAGQYSDDYASDVIEINTESLARSVNNQQLEATRQLPRLIGITAEISETALNIICELIDYKREEKQQVTQSQVNKLPANDIALEQAELVMSLGNGVANTSEFFACAEALGASVGGSRVVVDDGKLPRERQVGATGTSTAASVYLAFGISGAVQHLEGIKQCRTVIAINTDESCPMVARSDASYINDAVQVLQALQQLAVAQNEVGAT